jgi:thioredoxin-related protein
LITFAFITTLFSAELGWENSYEKALSQAKADKKDVYMLITSQDCRWCRKFEATTLQDAKTMARLKKQYVLLHIDRDWDEIPEHFKKRSVPRHYFLTNKGEIIFSFLGACNPEDFSSYLDDVDKKR